jgi:hypothetical protein
LFALLSAVVAAVAAQPTPERWRAGCEVIARAPHPHVAAVAGRVLAGCRPENAAAPQSLGNLAPVLRKAGLLGAA